MVTLGRRTRDRADALRTGYITLPLASRMLEPPSGGLPRIFSLVGLKPGEASQRYDLANRQDGGLMIDLVDPDGVTAGWLTEVLVAEGVLRSGSVVSCVAQPLEAMSFTGVFRRLELSYDVDEPGLPRTLIAKFSTPDPEVRAFIHSMGFYGREAAFYRELAATTRVPVPVCYYAAVDDNDGRCVILLQDLTTARRGRSTDACSPAEIERAVDAIAPLHARWWQNPDVEYRRWLDPEAIMPLEATSPEFEARWPVFLEKLSIPITDQVRQFGKWAAAELRIVMERLFYEPPLTVIHNDFQADNLLFAQASDSVPLVVIDWQMLVRGRGPVDLAYLLSGSMDPEDRRSHELGLVTRYAVQLEAFGVRDYSAVQCLEDYRAALLLPPVRLALAVSYMPNMTAHQGAFWDLLFQRQIRALIDNGAFGS
jgi:thiamine kinase-like enzyme